MVMLVKMIAFLLPIITLNITFFFIRNKFFHIHRQQLRNFKNKLTSFHKYLSCKGSNDFILQSFHYFKKPLTKP